MPPDDPGTEEGAVEERAEPRKFLLADPEEAPRKARFRRRMLVATSLFIIAVAGAIGARALIAQWTLTSSYEGWMRSDLERLASVQSAYHAANETFATMDELGPDFVPSQGVYVEITRVGAAEWSAVAEHVRTSTVCSVSVTAGSSGSADPVCQRR